MFRTFNIVAHRGYAQAFPENTLEAMQAAVDLGVLQLELDIQLTADHVPVVLHDATLERTTNGNGSVFDKTWDELKCLCAGDPEKFGDQFNDARISSLEEFLSWFSGDQNRHAYVEIKDESLEYFGFDTVIEKVLPLLLQYASQITIIAYDLRFLEEVRRRGWQGVGWILTTFNEQEREQAEQVSPDIIICNYKKVGKKPLWKGAWKWMHYEIVTADHARELAEKGVHYIETMEIERIIDELKPGEWRK